MRSKDNSISVAMPSVEIYTDGGCEPNPGPGGYGAVLLHPKKRAEASGGFRLTTNNRMEIFAAIAGLELLKQPCKVTLYSDSQYVVKAMSDGWVAGWKKKSWWRTRTERPENVDLWQRLDVLCQTHQVKFRWVKGHAGHLENERCDQLAMAALRQPNLPVDDGYENKPETEGVRPDMQEGEPCRKCSTPIVKRKRKWKPNRDYYYDFHLLCPKCQTTYHVESVKRFVQQSESFVLIRYPMATPSLSKTVDRGCCIAKSSSKPMAQGALAWRDYECENWWCDEVRHPS